MINNSHFTRKKVAAIIIIILSVREKKLSISIFRQIYSSIESKCGRNEQKRLRKKSKAFNKQKQKAIRIK